MTWSFSGDIGYASSGAMVVKTDEGWDAYPTVTGGAIGTFSDLDDAKAAADMTAASLTCCADSDD